MTDPVYHLNYYPPFGYQQVQHLRAYQVPVFVLRKNAQSFLVATAHSEGAIPFVQLTPANGADHAFPPELYLTFLTKDPQTLLRDARARELAFLQQFPGSLARIYVRGNWQVQFDPVSDTWAGRLLVAAIQDDPLWVAEYIRTGGTNEHSADR